MEKEEKGGISKFGSILKKKPSDHSDTEKKVIILASLINGDLLPIIKDLISVNKEVDTLDEVIDWIIDHSLVDSLLPKLIKFYQD